MAHFDLASATALLGKTVQVELVWDEEPQPLHCRTRIVGLVIGQAGLYEQPYFLTVDAAGRHFRPDEMFWSDIRSLQVLDE